MITQDLIAEVIDAQNEFWHKRPAGTVRSALSGFKILRNFANIITGIRRCGKSTLLHQLMQKTPGNKVFINFEDPRLAGFETDDFRRLDSEMRARKAKNLFLDEIQMLQNWELYVRQKLDEGFRVVVTGSNATLLSKELGTKLTGRHLSTELFPFSYSEYLRFRNKPDSLKAIEQYLQEGGFPEFLRTKEATVLQQLLDDILLRDIAVRYGVRDTNSLRRLAVYLISNIGKPVSATSLTKLFDVKAVSTVLEYFSYMQDAYLLHFVPKFSYSLKTQIRNPKKVYVVDLGLFTHNSIVFAEEHGRRLENAVFLHYRNQGKELSYFSEKKECDFVVSQNGKVVEVLQVCYTVNTENIHRETEGLLEAMNFFEHKKGTIVTLNQADVFRKEGKEITLLPIRNLLLDQKSNVHPNLQKQATVGKNKQT